MPAFDELRFETPAAWRELSPSARSAIARAGWAAVVVAAIMGVLVVGVEARRAHASLQRAEARVVAPTPPTLAAASPPETSDFMRDLPAAAPSDLQLRFAAKLAQEVHVTIQQMQAEPLKTEPGHLGQTRLLLQLRGDYRDVKSMAIAMLEKYPGLTLEHMTIRDRTATLAPARADRGDDEASLEMIQYVRATTSH